MDKKTKEKDYVLINVNKDFKKIVDDFLNEFEKEKGIRLSYSQATKIIEIKIKKIGGLKV